MAYRRLAPAPTKLHFDDNVEETLSQEKIWTSFCETIKASDKLKAEYILEYTAVRACAEMLVVRPLATNMWKPV
jgi:hypothetical protein